MEKYTGRSHTFAICAYKESPYLKECMASLRAQTVKSRIIVCTATPNDSISSAAAQYHIPVFVNPSPPGIASDWNFAIAEAHTPLVTLAHQDDIYEPDYLLNMLKALRKTERPLIAFSDYYEIRGGQRVGAKESRMLSIKEMMLSPLRLYNRLVRRGLAEGQQVRIRRRILSLGNPICCPSVTYVKDHIPKPLFQEHFKASLDWEAWERLSPLDGTFVYIHEPLVGHRIHEQSTTTEVIGSENGRSAEDLEMYRKFWPEGIARAISHFYSASQSENQL